MIFVSTRLPTPARKQRLQLRNRQTFQGSTSESGLRYCTAKAISGTRVQPANYDGKGKGGFWPPFFRETRLDLVALIVDGTQLSGHEVIGRPRAADRNLAIFELPGSGTKAILILLDGFAVDEVGDVKDDATGLNALAADLFFQRREQLIDLQGESSRFRLTLAFAGSTIAKFHQVIATNGWRKSAGGEDFLQGAIFQQQLDVHFSFAAQLGDRIHERFTVSTDRTAKSVIGFEDGAKLEGQHG